MRAYRRSGLKASEKEKTTPQVFQLIAYRPANREKTEEYPLNYKDERNAEQSIYGVQQSVMMMGRGIVEAIVDLQKGTRDQDQQQNYNDTGFDVRAQPEVGLHGSVSTLDQEIAICTLRLIGVAGGTSEAVNKAP